MDNKKANRRNFLKNIGLTVGTGLVSSSFVNQLTDTQNDECKTTPILELGPYGVMKYKKQADHDIDLTQINGNSATALGLIINVFGKVLDEYVGKYALKNETWDIKAFIKLLTGKDFKNIQLELTQNNNQLFMTLPFSLKIEMGWSAKDEFQSWGFNNTFVRFNRNENGKVVGLKLFWGEDNYALGTKKNNS